MSLPSLLLLPAPPTSITSRTIDAAYRPSIEAVALSLQTRPTSTQLFIAVLCPFLQPRLDSPRVDLYDEVQSLLAAIYSLFCVVCAASKIDVELDEPGSIDARVILLTDARSSSHQAEQTTFSLGPMVSLLALASTRRQWNKIFSVDCEKGHELLSSYRNCASHISAHVRSSEQLVPAGLFMVDDTSSHLQTPSQPGRFHHVDAVGGTFDHLHAGHKLLLTATAFLLQPSAIPRRLIVGITGDKLLTGKKYVDYLGTWKQRQEDVVNFLLSILLFTTTSTNQSIQTTFFNNPGPNGRAVHTQLITHNLTIECVEIQDPFGPTITEEKVTALIVSGETRSGGQAVNEKRAQKGWQTLDVFEIAVLDAKDVEATHSETEEFASKISSSAIRKRMAERRVGNGPISTL